MLSQGSSRTNNRAIAEGRRTIEPAISFPMSPFPFVEDQPMISVTDCVQSSLHLPRVAPRGFPAEHVQSQNLNTGRTPFKSTREGGSIFPGHTNCLDLVASVRFQDPVTVSICSCTQGSHHCRRWPMVLASICRKYFPRGRAISPDGTMYTRTIGTIIWEEVRLGTANLF